LHYTYISIVIVIYVLDRTILWETPCRDCQQNYGEMSRWTAIFNNSKLLCYQVWWREHRLPVILLYTRW